MQEEEAEAEAEAELEAEAKSKHRTIQRSRPRLRHLLTCRLRRGQQRLGQAEAGVFPICMIREKFGVLTASMAHKITL